MGGHGPSTDWGVDNASEYKAKLGVYMFIVYVYCKSSLDFC